MELPFQINDKNNYGDGTIYIPAGETSNYTSKKYPSGILIEE